MPKVKLKMNVYEILSRAVEEGVAYGWNRAHKYTDKPGEQVIKNAMYDAVTSALCEVVQME